MAGGAARDDVARFLAMLKKVGGPELSAVGVERARRIYRQTIELSDRPPPAGVAVADLQLPGPAGMLAARSYVPEGGATEGATGDAMGGAAILFLHGGGFVTGSLATHHSLAASIAACSGLPLVSLQYRLAPEAPFPAAVHDCMAAARWLASSPAALPFAARRLVLAGDSAGGTLAAVAARALRHELPLAAQWLMYPATDMWAKGGSLADFAVDHLLRASEIAWFHQLYAPDADDERASPLRSADWDGLPPALLFTAGLDPLRDQGRAYAAKLAATGNEVHFLEAAGQVHGSMQLRGAIPSAEEDLRQQVRALQGLLS